MSNNLIETDKIKEEKNVTDNVLNRLNEFNETGTINLPPNYSAPNALKSAYLILRETKDKNNKCVLETCTRESIANALLDMCIQGLSPAKKQCYFIPYGNDLKLSKSYLGNIAVTKRLKEVKDVFANIIYEGDEFEYQIDLETGLKIITKHNQRFENIDIDKIKGTYAVITRKEGQPYIEIMNIKQIKNSWNQGTMKGNSGAHKNFTEEMAKKTVINRACKMFLNVSDDSDLLIETITRTEEKEELEIVEESNFIEIEQNANKLEIDIVKDKVEEIEIIDEETKEEGPQF